MAITINGSGTVTGASTFSNNATFGGTLTTASRGISNASVPVGSIIQVVQTVKSDTFTSSVTGTWTDITGMSASITPTSSTSKILVFCNINACVTNNGTVRLLRGGSHIYAGTAAGSRTVSSTGDFYNSSGYQGQEKAIMFIDSPATLSSTTYKLQFWGWTGGCTFYLNSTNADSDTGYDFRSPSSITLMEIAQ